MWYTETCMRGGGGCHSRQWHGGTSDFRPSQNKWQKYGEEHLTHEDGLKHKCIGYHR